MNNKVAQLNNIESIAKSAELNQQSIQQLIQAQVSLQIENNRLGEKVVEYSNLIEEVGNLIIAAALPSTLTFRTVLANWRKIGTLIEAVVLVIRRYKATH